MAIGSALQRGSFVYVYDETGHQLTASLAGNGSLATSAIVALVAHEGLRHPAHPAVRRAMPT